MDLTTKYWMAGVVGAMLVFGLAALIGYLRQPEAEQDD